jgi:ubiquinol-cytochrome c reductase iron-sulfur subunit
MADLAHQNISQAPPGGPHGGWFCPCRRAIYDASGCIRRGPAPLNLAVPTYGLTDNTAIRIG